MKVVLTHHQSSTISHRVSPELFEFMVEHRVQAGKSHAYYLPAIAWRTIRDELARWAYGPQMTGGRNAKNKLPGSFYTAIQRISDAIGAMEAHPALRGMGMMGHHAQRIPVWNKYPWDGHIVIGWSPYPVEAAYMQVLVPRFLGDRGRNLTRWFPGSPNPEFVTEHEVSHLRFCVQVQPGRVPPL